MISRGSKSLLSLFIPSDQDKLAVNEIAGTPGCDFCGSCARAKHRNPRKTRTGTAFQVVLKPQCRMKHGSTLLKCKASGYRGHEPPWVSFLQSGSCGNCWLSAMLKTPWFVIDDGRPSRNLALRNLACMSKRSIGAMMIFGDSPSTSTFCLRSPSTISTCATHSCNNCSGATSSKAWQGKL